MGKGRFVASPWSRPGRSILSEFEQKRRNQAKPPTVENGRTGPKPARLLGLRCPEPFSTGWDRGRTPN